MTAIDHAPIRSAGAPRWLAALETLFEHLAAARRADELYRRYDRMSDAALAAQGLTRADVLRLAAREVLPR